MKAITISSFLPDVRPGTILAQAPSNIAIIKYMGKKDPLINLPENPSLSLTLSSLQSFVELEPVDQINKAEGLLSNRDLPFVWVDESPKILRAQKFQLGLWKKEFFSSLEIDRMIRHMVRTYNQLRMSAASKPERPQVTEKGGAKQWILRTFNSFPSSSGIASSASSFAAMTFAVATIFDPAQDWDSKTLSRLSRTGSGSSCRSFEGPWVLWDQHEVTRLNSQLPELTHFLILVSQDKKNISSSLAHEKVKTSPLWTGRVERACQRIKESLLAIQSGDFRKLSDLAWEEMWEVHSLFHTSKDSFTYWNPKTLEVLKVMQEWRTQLKAQKTQSCPTPFLVTMDAGPNIHLITRKIDAPDWKSKLQSQFPEIPIWQDQAGIGASGFVYRPEKLPRSVEGQQDSDVALF